MMAILKSFISKLSDDCGKKQFIVFYKVYIERNMKCSPRTEEIIDGHKDRSSTTTILYLRNTYTDEADKITLMTLQQTHADTVVLVLWG